MPSEGFRRHLCRRGFRAVSVLPVRPEASDGQGGFVLVWRLGRGRRRGS
ncbi:MULTISPECIES: hypothetical protein [Neisseria]|nr:MULTISPECIES: hypothetical protein [Neisseria]